MRKTLLFAALGACVFAWGTSSHAADEGPPTVHGCQCHNVRVCEPTGDGGIRCHTERECSCWNDASFHACAAQLRTAEFGKDVAQCRLEPRH